MAIKATHFHFKDQQSFYKGKVRDVYTVADQLIAISTDRISAFDHVLSRAIPYKGQVLNQLSVHFLLATKDLVPNWLTASPDPNVSIGLKCEPIKIEMVIRGYLAGHAWREYQSGKRELCGVKMPDGLKESDAFPSPLITPATKADEGHDEDISREEILRRQIVPEKIYELLESYTRTLYRRGQEMANERGLILVDTKYEFGLLGDKVYLIDEIHTPDSSRYYYLTGYEERQRLGQPQEQLSKEFVREWLMDHGFQGKEGQVMPEIPDSFVQKISEKYILLYEILTGQKFVKRKSTDLAGAIFKNILKTL